MARKIYDAVVKIGTLIELDRCVEMKTKQAPVVALEPVPGK
jgi:hypothetical protein